MNNDGSFFLLFSLVYEQNNVEQGTMFVFYNRDDNNLWLTMQRTEKERIATGELVLGSLHNVRALCKV